MAQRANQAKVTAAVRRSQALRLRQQGLTLQEIADHLGVTAQAVHKTLKVGLEELEALSEKEATALRTLECSRLDKMLAGLWPQAENGHLGAVDRVLKIMARRASLLGLDAAIEHEIELSGDGAIGELADKIIGDPAVRRAISAATFDADGAGRDSLHPFASGLVPGKTPSADQ